MEIEGLNITNPELEQKRREQAKQDSEQMIGSSDFAKSILEKVRNFKSANEETVVYGVYDNSDRGLFTRINDFLIDRSRVSVKDKAYFFHMLSMMVGAGLPVVKAVKSLARHTKNPRFRRVLNTIAYSCENGAGLADAMSRFEDVFEESEIGVVRAGEISGRLNEILAKLSLQLDKKHNLIMKLWGAAAYPLAVFGVLVLVAFGMLVWVLPTLIGLLQEGGIAGGDLPLATRIIIGLQNAVVNYWWLFLIAIFGIYGFYLVYKGTAHGAANIDYQKLKIPLVGELMRKVYVLNYVAILGLLIDAGLPVIKALEIAGNAQNNRVYRIKNQELIEFVRQGGKISEGMSDSEMLFPAEVVQMLRVGEASANLAKVSAKVSDQYQREVDNSLQKLTSVFEPMMILFVGLFVAILALAIMAPIFNLSSVVS